MNPLIKVVAREVGKGAVLAFMESKRKKKRKPKARKRTKRAKK